MSSLPARPNLISSVQRSLGRWLDPEQGNRAVAVLLVLFVLCWTVFQTLSRASVDLNPDLGEIYAWSRHPSAGYAKHPPLGALIAMLWFAAFPPTDWAFNLLAMVNAAIALFAVYHIARMYMPADKALLVLFLLLLTPFYQFHGQRFENRWKAR